MSSTGKRVAFIIPVNGGPAKDAYNIFSDEIRKYIPDVECRHFSVGQISPPSFYLMVKNIVAADFDILVVFNFYAAVIAQDEIRKKKKKTQLLFSGIISPEKHGLIKNYEKPGLNCTGAIYPPQDIVSYYSFFYDCFSHVKNIAIPTQMNGKSFYSNFLFKDARPVMMEDFPAQIQNFFHSKGIRCDVLSDHNGSSLLKILTNSILNYDAILVLEGSRITSWSKGINELCIKKQVLFYTGSSADVKRGYAPLGYGVGYEEVAHKFVEKAVLILRDGVSASEIPVDVIDTERAACVNKTTLRQYGIKFEQVKSAVEKWNAKIFE